MPIAIKTRFELNITAAVQVDGDCLQFHGTLVRAETNQNHDEIDSEAVQELASTLVGKALTYEHENKPVGYFTKAYVVDNAVECDAILWARRFPEVAAEVVNGERGLSVDATAAEGWCSMCGASFKSDADACDHVTNRFKGSGATRKMRGMICRGGGVVRHPAGTGTVIDAESLRMVASAFGSEFQALVENPVVPDTRSISTYTPETYVDGEQENENGGAGLDPVTAIAEVLEKAGVPVEEPKAEEVVEAVAETVAEAAKPKEGSAEEEAGESDSEEKKEDMKEDMKAKASVSVSLDAQAVQVLIAANAEIKSLRKEVEDAKVSMEAAVALEAKLTDRIIALGEVIGFEDAKGSRETLRKMDDAGFELLVKSASKNSTATLKLPVLPVEGSKTDAEFIAAQASADKADESGKKYDLNFVFAKPERAGK